MNKKLQEAEARQKEELRRVSERFWPKLKDTLVAKGCTVEIPKTHIFGGPNTDNSFDKVDGIRVAMTLRPARAKYVGDDPSDKIRFYVYEEPVGQKVFQPGKRRGGEFDYEAIADAIIRIVQAEKDRRREDQNEAEATLKALETRTRLVEAVGAHAEEQRVFIGSDDLTGRPFPNLPREGNIHLTVGSKGVGLEVDAPVSEEVLLELLQVCKKHGLIT